MWARLSCPWGKFLKVSIDIVSIKGCSSEIINQFSGFPGGPAVPGVGTAGPLAATTAMLGTSQER